MDDFDIWRAAAEMIRQFGKDAAVTAGRRGDALLEQGDAAGVRIWLRIVAAITELERKPGPGEPKN